MCSYVQVCSKNLKILPDSYIDDGGTTADDEAQLSHISSGTNKTDKIRKQQKNTKKNRLLFVGWLVGWLTG